MKNSQSNVRPDELSGELASLPALDPERLKERWRTLYGTEPPPRISEDLLRRAVAYRLQERALSGPLIGQECAGVSAPSEARLHRIHFNSGWAASSICQALGFD